MAPNLIEITNVYLHLQLIIFSSWAESPTVIDKSLMNTTASRHPSPSFIIGGRKAKDGEFPYIVAIMLADVDPDEQEAAGSLIRPNWVITARHVLVKADDLQLRKVLVSPKYSNKISEMRGKKRYQAEKMFCYYVKADGSDMHIADVALVKLKENIPLGKNSQYGFQTISPIRSNNDVDWTKEVTIMGWGQTRHTSTPKEEDWADHLMVLTSKLNPTKECRDYFGDFKSPETFCLGHEFKTAGRADSGGPAIMKHVDKNIDIQVGVLSYGKPSTR